MQRDHQSPPSSRHVTGPSSGTTIQHVVHDNDSSLETRTVERRPMKYRSKQKARASSSAPSEVIEISSDEDEPPVKKRAVAARPLERLVKDLKDENQKLREALEIAKAPKPEENTSTPVPVVQVDRFLSNIASHVNCEVCTVKMWDPYTLTCGHTFCAGCLRHWFEVAFSAYLENFPTYDPELLVPLDLRTQLARVDLPSYKRRAIAREVTIIFAATTHPYYSCPTCRTLIRVKPAENFVIKNLVQTIATTQEELAPKGQSSSAGPFDKFFPFAKFI